MSILQIPTARALQPLLAPARYKGAHGGRGSMKSHFFAGLMVEECISQKTDAICLREIQKSIKFSVKKTIEGKIESMNAGYYFSVQDEIIKAHDGGIILFQGMQNHTAESIKSLEDFRVAYLEEAQSFSQRSLDLLRPTMRREDSEIWAAWNPHAATDPIEVLLRPEDGKMPPRAIVVEVSYKDNPWFPQTLRDEMEYDLARDPDKYAHIWLGQYEANSEARVFRNWTVEEFDTPSNATLRLGADWGFSVDPTVLVRCFIGRWEGGIAIPDDKGKHLFIDYEAYEIGCEINKTPELFDTVPDARKWIITADSARPETISHMKKNGFPKIAGAIKGARSIEEGVEFLKNYSIIVHPRCPHTADDLTLYSYKVDDLTGKPTNILADKSNNVIDSLRYACEGVRRAKSIDRPKIERPTYQPGAWMQ